MISFLILNEFDFKQKAYRKLIVTRVLDYRKKNPARGPVRKLETIIRNELKISGGFRNPLSAPPKLLYDEVLRASYLSETLLSIILQVWMESHHDLSTLMSAHLDALGIAVIKENAAHGFEDQWFPGQLSEMVNNFKKDHAQFNEDDILLMLCCLTRRGPSTESLVWEQWIEELKSLSYESRVWDMMGGFINMLGQLTSDKLKQREQQAIRTRLEDALTLLRQDAADIIRYFEIKDIAKWSSETCAPKDLESAADQVGRFRETVFTYWKLCQKPVPTLGKRRTRNKELTQMEDAILDTYHQLRSLLTGTKTIGTTTDEPGQDGKQTEEKEAVPAISDKKQVPAQPVSDTKTVSLETVTDEERTPPHKEIRVVSEPGTISDTSPPSIRDPGSRIQADHWNGLLWYLVRANDLPLAYWLTRSLAASDINPDLPPWLLSAVQGARWISYDSHAYIADLQDIAANHCPDSTDAQKLMGLAAALCPALMPHTKGFVSWLEPPKTYPALCQFAEKITQFTQLGIYPEDFLIMAGEDYRKNKFKQISDRARQWLDHAIRKKIKFKNKVWRHLVRTNGKLHTMVWPVVQDARESMEQVRQDMKQWSDPRVAKKCFDDIDHELTGRKPKSIVGCALTQLMNGVEEACEIARRWCDLAEREKKFQAQGSKWLVNQGNQLRAHVREMLPQVETTLADISQSATYSAAGAHCIWIAIRQLQELLQIPLENADIADGKTKWEWVRTDCRKLHHALDRSLILFPEIPLKDNGSPFREAIPKIAPAIRNNGRRTLEDIVGIWLEKQDYRFTDHILRSATEKDSQAERLGRACQTNLNGSRLTLRQKKSPRGGRD